MFSQKTFFHEKSWYLIIFWNVYIQSIEVLKPQQLTYFVVALLVNYNKDIYGTLTVILNFYNI